MVAVEDPGVELPVNQMAILAVTAAPLVRDKVMQVVAQADNITAVVAVALVQPVAVAVIDQTAALDYHFQY